MLSFSCLNLNQRVITFFNLILSPILKDFIIFLIVKALVVLQIAFNWNLRVFCNIIGRIILVNISLSEHIIFFSLAIFTPTN